MHPALIVLIIVSVPLGAWAAYEGAEYVKEWWSERQDRKQYEEFVRQHFNSDEKLPVYRNRGFDDDDDDDDDVPLVKSMSGRRAFSGGLRQRNSLYNYNSSQSLHDDYELTGMENSIIARRHQLAREQALLDQQEMDLQRRRQSLQNRGNSLMGMSSPSLSSAQQPRCQQLESSTTSLESSHTARNNNGWVFTRPPQPIIEPSSPLRTTAAAEEDLGPKLGVIEVSELDAIRYHHDVNDSNENDNDDLYQHNRTMQMPEPQHLHSRQVSESEESWADVHSRNQSGTSASDEMSYNSLRTPSSPRHSYGVHSISSDDNDSVATF